MNDSISIDFSEIDTIAADIEQAAIITEKRVRQATEISARKIKDSWAQKLTGENGLPHAPRSITYDVEYKSPGLTGRSAVVAEIGAETGRLQAPIVTVVEFGAPGNNTAPRGYGAGALQETEADFLRGLELATDPRL